VWWQIGPLTVRGNPSKAAGPAGLRVMGAARPRWAITPAMRKGAKGS
jgi:hypothetical protein